MISGKTVRQRLLLLIAIVWTAAAQAQHPTASQALGLSAFGGVTGVFTGLEGGKNLSFTAGVDLAFPPLYRMFRPTFEVRGKFPMDGGTIVSQKDIMGGARVDVLLGRRYHPYGDFLFGRGQMDYQNGGFVFNNFQYELTTTYVWSAGGGVDYDLNDNFSVKADGQYQHWGSAPTTSGSLYSTSVTLGVVYRFNFNHHHR